jgi:hypothetical protein
MAPFVEFGPESLAPGADLALPAGARYVVKLANVLHRTDVGAVEKGVGVEDVGTSVRRLAAIADHRCLSRDIVVQPELPGRGELIVGVHSGSGFGPTVLVGLGGVFTEVMAEITCRTAPLTEADADEMIRDLRGRGILVGVRGQPPWHLAQLQQLLVDVSRFACATSEWLDSIELNPVIVAPEGLFAVDICCILRPPPAAPGYPVERTRYQPGANAG